MKRRILFAVVLCGAVLNVATASAVTITEPLGPNWFFQPPENLGPVVNSSGTESSPTISSDGLTLIFSSDRPGSQNNGRDLWQSTRTSLDAPWTEPTNLGGSVNGNLKDSGPDLSSDGLTLFFYRENTDIGRDSLDLYQSTRSTPTSPWAPAVPMLGINSNYADGGPSVSDDGLTFMFESDRLPTFGLADIWQATRASTAAPWGPPSNVNVPVNSDSGDSGASLSTDGLTLIWNSGRSGGLGRHDIWFSSRETASSTWNTPMRLSAAVNTTSSDYGPDYWSSTRTIVFSSGRADGYGDYDMWSSTAIPATAYSRFDEIPIGMRNYNGSGQEMGFSTTIFPATGGANPKVGVDNSERPRLRMQSIEAETTFETVDLSGLEDVEFAIDVRNSDTSWEPGDYVRVTLTNGTTTHTVLDLRGTSAALETAGGVWRNYRHDIPDHWTEARLTIASSSNSTGDAEIFDFDNIAFFGTPVPEPATFMLLAFGLLGLPAFRRRK